MGKVYGEAITKRIRLEMKQKGRIKNNGCDVLCICVSELGMYYWRWQWVRMMNAERRKCPTNDEEYDENTLGEVEAKDVCSYWIQVKKPTTK